MEPDWVDIFDGATVADEQAYHAMTNGHSPASSEPDSWAPLNLAELADTPPVEPTLGGLSLCYPGKRHVFSGPQESAKTLAAYVIGLSVVRTGATVVLIDFEMGPWDAKTRLRELGASDEEIGAFLYVAPDAPSSPGAVGRLVEAKPALVLLDAAAGAFELDGHDDNSRKDVERWARAWVTPFWKSGIATIVLDHVTKNVESRGTYAIGSERKVGGADVHLGFSVVRPIKRGDNGRYKITTHKDRGGHLKRGHLCDFVLNSDPETHAIGWQFEAPQVVDDAHPFRPTHLMEKVSRYLELQGQATTIGDVKAMIEGKAEFVIQAVNLLVAEGFIEESEGARKARMLTSNQPYREDADDPFPTRSHPFPDSGISPVPRSSPPLGGERVGGYDAENGNGSGTGANDEFPF